MLKFKLLLASPITLVLVSCSLPGNVLRNQDGIYIVTINRSSFTKSKDVSIRMSELAAKKCGEDNFKFISSEKITTTHIKTYEQEYPDALVISHTRKFQCIALAELESKGSESEQSPQIIQ